MIIVKILFVLISITAGVIAVIEQNKIPYTNYSIDSNCWRIVIVSVGTCLVDLLLCIIVKAFMPNGTYGTGLEFLSAIIVLIVYGPICLITSYLLKRRMKEYEDSKHNIKRMNCLNYSVLFKAAFMFLVTIWIVEVR